MSVLALLLERTGPFLERLALQRAAFCGTAMVLESWLNALASTRNAAGSSAFTGIVDLAAADRRPVPALAFGATGTDILVIIALLFCGALIPVMFAREDNLRWRKTRVR
ncbi:MAG: hypothetical protein HPM95_05590 [Alphaproteobacteria bacterium]|nr:hypothetical protein [Alphaproteobacteria bacterium]